MDKTNTKALGMSKPTKDAIAKKDFVTKTIVPFFIN